MTFVIAAILAPTWKKLVYFHGKFTWRLNLLCARGVLGYSLDIGSES